MTNAMLCTGLFGDLFRDAEIAREYGAEALLGHMIAFERAWTGALAANGIVTRAEAEGAQAALAGFDAAAFRPQSDRDGMAVPSLIAHLRAGLATGPARAIHSGATSQDVIDTALVLAGLSVLARLEARLARLLELLDGVTAEFGMAPLMARTRMQAALPATVALRVDAWARLLQAQMSRLPALREELGKVQIGGAIGQREAPGDEAVARHVAEALGLRLTPVWHGERSAMVSLGHWLGLVAGALGKIGQDVALMAQQGLDEIALTGGGGSSAMPHKQNPVLAETIVALARYVAGQQGILMQAMIHEQERSGAAWALEWLTLPAMAEATGTALRHAEALLAGIERIGAPG